ncbi:hypothetical protein JRQ81_008775 [Phrynocephalus forsythii]|uniref:Nuclear receptor 2C2-associated protein n=1 Tax=Phrynocephalus forsythii TaxID=171643 RepID=A0A9Q0XAN6_9SAUR|nr:hypothetical protein JRQ81_008775 [Phrynocephalus forsythii]
MPGESLICPKTASRVSSVLNREAKQFGKQNMFDGNEETCWNSDQGPVQWLTLEFPQPVRVSRIQIQFQGGFSSRKCTVQVSNRNCCLDLEIATLLRQINVSLSTFAANAGNKEQNVSECILGLKP